MSYILEALRKMDKQRKQDSTEGSWVESLTAEPEEEKEETHRPMRWLLAASVFFGLAGIITGFALYHGSQTPEKGPVSSPPARSQEAQAVEKAPPRPKPKVETQALTVSEIKAALVAKEEGQEGRKPKDAPVQKEGSQEIKSHPEAEAKVIVPKMVPPAPDAPLPQDKVMDLTSRYRLSSIGEVNQKKYATLDRKDYSVGDEFMGMVITAIERDRVHLKGKADGQRYVIRFGYR